MGRCIKRTAVAVFLLVIAGGATVYLFPGLFFEPALRVLRLWNGLQGCEVQAGDHRWVYLDGGQGEAVLFYRPPGMPGPLKEYFAKRGAEEYNLREKILRDLDRVGIYLLEDRLRAIRARTLILWGANDRILDPSCVGRFQKGLKDCRVSGHNLSLVTRHLLLFFTFSSQL
jgi:pimeloyl-ACP methyl ester carboxylesterase